MVANVIEANNFTIINPDGGLWSIIYNEHILRNKNLKAQEKEIINVFISLTQELSVTQTQTHQKKSFTLQEVFNHCTCSQKTFFNYYKLLKEKGHLVQVKTINTDTGSFSWSYIIHQKPLEVPLPEVQYKYVTGGVVRDKNKKAHKVNYAALSAEYGLTPEQLQNLRGELTGEIEPKPVTEAPAPVAKKGTQLETEKQGHAYYAMLLVNESLLLEIVKKYKNLGFEISREGLNKHIENFKTVKDNNTDIELYYTHFNNYVGKMLKVEAKKKPDFKKQPFTPNPTNAPAGANPAHTNDEIEAEARQNREGMKQSIKEANWKDFKQRTELFIYYAQIAKSKGIENEKMYHQLDFFTEIVNRPTIGGQPTALRQYFDEKTAIDDPIIRAFMSDTKNRGNPISNVDSS